jgi:hypothetical protein
MKTPSIFKLTLICDLAGVLTESAINADHLTAACICLPSGRLSDIRKKIPTTLPKWKNATVADVNFVIELLRVEAWGIYAISVNKATPMWQNFWKEANATHKQITNEAKGPVSLLKAAINIKFAYIGTATSMVVAHAIKINSCLHPKSKEGIRNIKLAQILDKEIDGAYNLEAYESMLDSSNKFQPKTNSLNLNLETISVQHLTEQEDRLLMLPDYVAGIAHAMNSQADTLSKSNITRKDVQAASVLLKSNPKYLEQKEDFSIQYFDIYPNFKS